MNSDMAGLVNAGVLTEDAAAFLQRAVHAHLNIVVSGPAGVGKTRLLSALVQALDGNTGAVAVAEESPEIDCSHLPGSIQGLTRVPDVHGEDDRTLLLNRIMSGLGDLSALKMLDKMPLAEDVSMRDLVRGAARLRPERIIVGDVSGAEAFDLLQMMRTGFDGSMFAVRSASARGTLDRLHDYAMLAGDAESTAITRMIGEAVQIVVHLRQEPTGSQDMVDSIFEVEGRDRAVELWSRDAGGELAFQGTPSVHLAACRAGA